MDDKQLKILEIDPFLKPFEKDLILRMDRYEKKKKEILKGTTLKKFSSAYNYYGFHKVEGGYIYREWAPNAEKLFLMGDFNGWNRDNTPMTKIDNENFEVFVPYDLKGTYVKVRVVASVYDMERIPLYATYIGRDDNYSMTARVFESEYEFVNEDFKRDNTAPIIYECHIGMAEEKEGYGSYDEFRTIVLPKVKDMGFNTIQIMGIMEHPYYGSFGYQVSNFFAPCSLFGTPDDLRHLIDDAHGMGIAVLLDIVHSHAVKNTIEGINMFDGSEGQFFIGDHPAWDSKVFNYGKKGVLQFLLSNVRYYMEEFKFDGYRFDGVTSMLYTHYGLGTAFDCYDKYFSYATNIDAINYLQLATEVMQNVNKKSLKIAEDMSGMPGMCLPIKDGGIGFDYRLMMGTPDMWIKLIDDTRDENWSMNQIYYELSSRRPMEKAIGYAESHDQALVGDKTILFRLCDKEMYWHMNKDDDNFEVARGIGLYKLIYGVTMTLGGDGYLNFMGNEFGHPEWIDFPREGNGFSFKYARRQWSLADNPMLKYQWLRDFNREIISIIKEHKVHSKKDVQIYVDEDRKIISYRKGDLLFAMSFHHNYSATDLFLQLNERLDASLIFTTDESRFGGYDRVKTGETHYNVNRDGSDGVMVYVPSRCFNVYKLSKTVVKKKRATKKVK